MRALRKIIEALASTLARPVIAAAVDGDVDGDVDESILNPESRGSSRLQPGHQTWEGIAENANGVAENEGNAMSPPDGESVEYASEVWLADLTYTQQAVSSESFPLGVSLLASYVQSQGILPGPIRLFKYPEALAEALAESGPPKVLGFSHYVWNARLSRHFAEAVKRVAKDTVIVFGGPHFPIDMDKKEEFLRAHPAIDFYVEHEGEVALTKLLEILSSNDWNPDAAHGAIPSVHSIGFDGRAHLMPLGTRLRELAVIPSPYLSGLLDPFFDGRLVPSIQTTRGCPFSCTFCVEGDKTYSKVSRAEPSRTAQELFYIGSRMAELLKSGARNELIITDSNFGMFATDRETCEAIRDCQEQYGWPRQVYATTGKNSRRRVLENVRITNGAIFLSGAVQSLDQEVLSNVKRNNISVTDLAGLALDASETGTMTNSDVVLGLPGDSYEKHIKTVSELVDAQFDRISIFQLSMLPGSELDTGAQRELHTLTTRFRVIPRCFGVYNVLGSTVSAAEIDEVCVSTANMPFDDYLECRYFDLLVHTLYGDGAFRSVVVVLRALGVSVSSWIHAAASDRGFEEIEVVRRDFFEANREQLWLERGELEHRLADPDYVRQFVEGRLGNNVLTSFGADLQLNKTDKLVELAERALREVVSEGHLSDTARMLLDECLRFEQLRTSRLFSDASTDISADFSFDIPRVIAENAREPIESYLFSDRTNFRFFHDKAQVALIDSYRSAFGDNPAAAGRALRRMPLARLLRQARREADDMASAGMSER
jgi:radical SAM superfamily enzyme YgiQ (UPF0313 family)